MGTVARGEITLSAVGDAYSVSLNPSVFLFCADYDGSNPNLENANAYITVSQGKVKVPFSIIEEEKSSNEISYLKTPNQDEAYQFIISIKSIPKTDIDGFIRFKILIDDYENDIILSYQVSRNATMLDWIEDWEGSKTKIGGSYIMTPKLFVGKKEDVVEYIESQDPNNPGLVPEWRYNTLTGVYIGPDLLNDNSSFSTGLYGYHAGNEIFHLNEQGGLIGGWNIERGGIQTSDGKLRILSEGSVIAKEQNTIIWELSKNGEAVFAKGKVAFHANGDAKFEGQLTASEGVIGGWEISADSLSRNEIHLDSAHKIIGILTGLTITNESLFDLKASIKTGGLMMYHTSSIDYGLACYLPSAINGAEGDKVFSLGSSNSIAGWQFNKNALYRGSVVNEANGFTLASGDITIGFNGIRGYKWRIDSNGTAAFSGGKVVLNENDGQLFGWSMSPTRLSSNHIALISDPSCSGIFLTSQDITGKSISLLSTTINSNGGIFISSDANSTSLRAINNSGLQVFALSTTENSQIGPWHFTSDSIYIGKNELTASGVFKYSSDENSLILSTDGVIGKAWCLLKDGSGSLAYGNLSWDKNGIVTFSENVTLNWANISGAIGNKLTKIDSNGVYTGNVSADNITAGTISSVSIRNDEFWALNSDGSGYMASKNILWKTDGSFSASGIITANQLKLSCVALMGGETLYASFNTAVWSQLKPEQTVFFLGELAECTCQTIDVMLTSPSDPGNTDIVMTLQTVSDNVRIVTGAKVPEPQSIFDVASDMEIKGRLGLYRITGWREEKDNRTIWNVTLVDGVTPSTSVPSVRVINNPYEYRHDPNWGFIH